jgi:hypothetical protein
MKACAAGLIGCSMGRVSGARGSVFLESAIAPHRMIGGMGEDYDPRNIRRTYDCGIIGNGAGMRSD